MAEKKRSLGRKIAIGGGIVIALLIGALAGGVYFIYSNMNELVRGGTERGLEYVLEVDAAVGGADVQPQAGSIALSGIDIPNPEGFKAPSAFSLGSVQVVAPISLEMLKSDTITIDLIRIVKPEIIFEKTLKTSNFQELIKSASRLSASDEAEQPAPEPEAGPSKNLRIKKLIVESTVVGVTVPATGGRAIKVKIPELVITDFDKNQGVPMSKVISLTLKTILTAIVVNGADIPGIADLRESLEAAGALATESLEKATAAVTDAGKKAVEAVDQSVDKAKEAATEATEAATEAVDKVGDTVKESVGKLKEDLSAENVSDAVKEATEGATKAVDEAVGGITDSLGGLLGSKKKKEEAEAPE